MAIFRIRAIAPPVDPPMQWGSNIFVATGHANPPEQGLNPQQLGSGSSRLTLQIRDFTTDTNPPFIPKPNKSFYAIKINTLVYHGVNADGNTKLLLNNVQVTQGSIITRQQIEQNLLVFEVAGVSGGNNTYIEAEVLFSDTNGEFSEEAVGIMTFVGTRKMQPANFTFLSNATLNVINPIHTVGATELSNLFNINFTEVDLGAWQETDMNNYFNLLNLGLPYKIEFRNMDNCKALTYYGKIIEAGQRIQTQAFLEGRVKIQKDLLDRDYDIELAFGHGYTGRFRITTSPNV